MQCFFAAGAMTVLGALLLAGSAALADESRQPGATHPAPVLLAAGPTVAEHRGDASGSAIFGPLTIEDAYVRASLGRATRTVGYMQIATSGGADRLIAAASPAADAVELHSHATDEQGVMRMRPVAAIEVSSQTPAVLEPGGLHLMLTGLGEPLDPGASIPLTPTFEQAGEVSFEVPVRALAGTTGAAQGHGRHGSESADP